MHELIIRVTCHSASICAFTIILLYSRCALKERKIPLGILPRCPIVTVLCTDAEKIQSVPSAVGNYAVNTRSTRNEYTSLCLCRPVVSMSGEGEN
ncbi:hypothetical protein EJ05DRAFT_56901 [Pseudovirgaria hyperparasitica]|uniref:Uncharacterized protein n=1 Tax=Pseudovirgaria hyperparasitica TaxID=470096 RepID=A0A6A6W5B6_9PEZI|nr:uncharacterized protein EJ05DRAFT_56901 [Pseudovirgaria hyperparasitica]KAF2757146.1 hypothetical protein EJ05DRAFT_56901 [Pseudovirgaria hyperparasitica]